MVQITWTEPESSSIVPAVVVDAVQHQQHGLTSWELAYITLPGCLLSLVFPRTAHLIVSLYRLVLGTLYPAYSSYKAIRTKDVKEYVKWMMYWVVFALFTTAETITDMFLSFWFPFYYELKIIVVLWLLSPATQGSSILYRQFVHPILVKREQEIDEYLHKAKEESYKTVVELGTKGVQYASKVIAQAAINGGGGLMSTLRKSYSVGDVSDGRASNISQRPVGVLLQLDEKAHDDRPPTQLSSLQDVSDSEFEEIGEELEEILMRPPSQRAPRSRITTREVFFSEIDSLPRRGVTNNTESYSGEIRSVEDISSGYSSTEFLPAEPMEVAGPVTRRTASVRLGPRAARPVTIIEGGSSKVAAGKNLNSDITTNEAKPRVVKRRAPPPPPTPNRWEGSFVRHSTPNHQEKDDQEQHVDLRQALNALKRIPRP